MNYLEWNNALGKWYFNEEKAEQEVYLFITKQDIIKVGKEQGVNGNDEEIFLDYIKAFREGVPGKPSKGNILEQALYAFDKWQTNPVKIYGIPINYPLYIGYLTLFLLPLTESHDVNFRANAYYPKIKSFLKDHGLPSMPEQHEHNNWNSLWSDLFYWSFEKKNTELGYFEVHPFQNKRWVYVGKPLSQSIFPIQAIRQLPQIFETSGLVPGEEVDSMILRKLLLANGGRHLALSSSVINAIRDPDNELGQSIISIVKKNFQEWTGITDQYDLETKTTKKGNTIAQLRLCIEGDRAKGYKTYYRLYSKLDLPEDLAFMHYEQKYKCQQFGKGWSKPLFLPFSEGMILQDNLNRWKASFPQKDIRLFIEGKNFHLCGWVEVPYMLASRMLLLVKEEKSAIIEEWGSCFSAGGFKKMPAIGLLQGHVLYEFCNPPIGHPDISILQFRPDKKINLIGGVKTGVRTWLKDLLPDVELENGRGTETIYLNYEDSNSKILLDRKNIDHPIWSLPPDIKTNQGFYLTVEGDNNTTGHIKNFIIDSHGPAEFQDKASLPIPSRDNFGQIVSKQVTSSYVVGNELFVSDERSLLLRQANYSRDFRPQITYGKDNSPEIHELNHFDTILVTLLTVKGQCNARDYYEAFESVYQKKFRPEEIESHTLELSKLKRWSLNFLDYMGILDYEYATKNIVVKPLQFILIPTSSGRKALLTGGRTPELLNKIKVETEKEGLHLTFEPQDISLSPFILPPTVTVTGFDECDGNKIENKLAKLAKACSISFNPNNHPQFKLTDFSGSIRDYSNQLVPDERFDDSGWPVRNFDAEQLRFIPIETPWIDKKFSLVEYRLNEYTLKHRLWLEGQSYEINKNWGRYMILKHYKREVFYNDREKNLVAIPAALPLPRLLSEALVLYSGRASIRAFLNLDGTCRWYNIYTNIPHIAAYNACLKVGQKLQDKTIYL